MWFVSTQPPYGTSMPGAGAVHHIKLGGSDARRRVGYTRNSNLSATLR
jgi:hypothetical protein